MANTHVNLGRNVPLLRQGFATDQLVTDQQYQVAQLQSTLKYDQGAIDNARTQLSYTTLTAPFDGVAGLRLMDVGNVIHPTDANGLVVLTQVQPISVIFTLPARDIGQVQEAMAHGAVQTVVFDQAGTRKLDTGTLLAVNSQRTRRPGRFAVAFLMALSFLPRPMMADAKMPPRAGIRSLHGGRSESEYDGAFAERRWCNNHRVRAHPSGNTPPCRR